MLVGVKTRQADPRHTALGVRTVPAAALLDRELARHLGLAALGLVAVGAFLWEIGCQARGPALAFPFALLQAAPSSSPIR